MSSANSASLQVQPIETHLETTALSLKKIMVATDFSEQSQLAAKYAARLAQQMRSQLELLHIVPSELYLADPYVLPAVLEEAECARGMAALHEFAKNIPDLRIVRHKSVVLSGLAAESIIHAAEGHGIDLLVMGSHGRSGVKKLALGSVAEKVVRNLHCPVLVTGPQCNSQHEGVGSVLLAVDNPPHSLRAAQYAVAIAQQSGATLTVAHIYPAVQPEDIDSSKINSTLRALHSLVPSQLDLAKTVQFRTAKGGISEEILNIASECKAGIIVTSPKGHAPLAEEGTPERLAYSHPTVSPFRGAPALQMRYPFPQTYYIREHLEYFAAS